MAMALGGALGVVLALGPDDLGHLRLHQLVHDAEPDANAQGEQPLLRCPDEFTQRLLDLRWERALRVLGRRGDLRCGYLLHGGSSCSAWTSSTPHASNGSGRGGRDRR